MTSPEPIRVIVCDDQALIRSALVALLRESPGIRVVGEAEDGAAAVEAAKGERPDVILMDIRMPGMDGLEATRAVKADNKDVAVVMLTTFDLDEYVLEAIQSGASGFLLKAGDADELIRAIHVAAEGDALISPHALRRLLDTFMVTPKPDSDAAACVARLTEREREVLSLAATGQSNSEIATSLVIGEATVKTHISSILRKLVARDRVHAVVIAYKAGLASGGTGS